MTNYLSALLSVFVGRITKSEKGATMVEYGLIVAAIALVVVVGATFFGSQLTAAFNGWATSL